MICYNVVDDMESHGPTMCPTLGKNFDMVDGAFNSSSISNKFYRWQMDIPTKDVGVFQGTHWDKIEG